MILTDQQRDALITEITSAIMENERTKLLFDLELENDRSELFVTCLYDYQEQTDAIECARPFYVEDERGTFGFMRLRDDNGRILGYEGHDGKEDPADGHYNPSPADKRKIATIIGNGTPLYCYISNELAIKLGIVLTEYTKPAIYEFERKRHRRFDLTDPNPNNSAPFMALYKSYFSQYGTVYDLPTLTAGTDARKGYYVRLIQRAANGEITYNQVRRFPHGKGLHPKTWDNGFPDDADFGIFTLRMAIGYNSYVELNGKDRFPSDESEIDDTRLDPGLFSGAIR